jgi:hypothetical protein
MVRTGPISKLDKVERAIIEMLLTSHSRVHGMGFREIYRNLKTKPKTSRAGSFSTLKKCLCNLKANQVVYRNPGSKNYFFNDTTFAYYHRDLVVEAILQSNVLGGGDMWHPDPYPVLEGDNTTFPKGKPEICVAKNTFIQANLKGLFGFTDEGLQFIWTHAIWPEKLRKDRDKVKKATRPSREPLHFEKIVIQRLNPARTARDWVKAIWSYAQENKLVSQGLTLENASNEDLEKIWGEIFTTPQVKTIVSTEFIDPKILLEWLKASKESKKLNFNGGLETEKA